MQVCANLPLGRDLRLDLLRCLANWAIFLDQIPHEVMRSITTRNCGFSDAAGRACRAAGCGGAKCACPMVPAETPFQQITLFVISAALRISVRFKSMKKLRY